MADGLLPCPFCGHDDPYEMIYSGAPTIRCGCCPALMGGEESNDSEEVLRAAWNRRATQEMDAKDAARYRWLRDKADGGEWEHIGHGTTPETTDDAVDAAIAAQGTADGGA